MSADREAVRKWMREDVRMALEAIGTWECPEQTMFEGSPVPVSELIVPPEPPLTLWGD